MEDLGALDWTPSGAELAELAGFLEREHEAQLMGREALYDRPVSERVAAGGAVADLAFAGEARQRGETLWVFVAPRNDSRLRPGSRVRLSHGDARRPAARLELVDDHFDGKRYVLRLSGECKESLESSEPWVLDEEAFDLLETQRLILRRAEEEGLDAWLRGEETYAFSPEGDSPTGSDLEGSLREAFLAASAAEPWFAVQGPPGSGKTHLLARLALRFALEEGARVLVSAVSHQAIHHALAETYWAARRMAPLRQDAREFLEDGFFKFGASRGNNEGLPEGVRAVPRLNPRKRPLIAGGTVYAALHAASSASEGRKPFDLVLFDEAGQAPLTLALAARLLAGKAVFIGDDAQLPPIAELPSGEEAGALARLSVLQFARERYEPPFLLRETRRLNRELCSVVSESFYGGALAPTPEAALRRFALRGRPEPPFDRLLGEESLVFLDAAHSDGRSLSDVEARWAAAIAREAVRCGLAPQELGIIAPYRAQCNRIRFLLKDLPGVLCSTVERFQGQEREMVLLSMTSSKPAYLSRLAPFLFDPHRVNVAVSRARSKVVIVGALSAFKEAARASEDDPEWGSELRAFLRLAGRSLVVEGLGEAPERAGGSAAPAGEAFEPGTWVEHPRYGSGRIEEKAVEFLDGKGEWVNAVRFADGEIRRILPRLCEPPMRRLDDADLPR